MTRSRSACVVLTLAITCLVLGATGPGRAQPDTGEVADGHIFRGTEHFALTDARPAAWYEPPEIRPGSGAPIELTINTGLRRAGGDPRRLPRVLVPTSQGDVLRPVNLRSYGYAARPTNGLVGPTIRVPRRHDLRIRLVNDLAPDVGPCVPGQHDTPDCFDHTNFHTHGLHISPRGRADNVLITLTPRGEPSRRCVATSLRCGTGPGEPEPGCCFRGEFTHEYPIGQGLGGDGHYPGTFWYHAHKHGSTAVQLASGMAGALIVDDPPDSPIAGFHERVLMVQQLAFDDNSDFGQVLPRGGSLRDLVTNWGGRAGRPFQRYTTINGVAKPGVPMCKDEVQRWRIIDSGIFEMVPIELAWVDAQGEEPADGNAMAQLIAYDGITVKKPLPVFGSSQGPVDMGPGYRVDLLVKNTPPREGMRLQLRKRAPTDATMAFEGMDSPGLNQVLAEVVADTTGRCRNPFKTKLLDPALKLPFPLEDLPERPTSRKVEFNVKSREPLEPLFLINGRSFGHHVHEEFCLPYGEVEQWRLSTAKTGGGGDIHPFHIHVNAFQVIRNGQPAEWRDTILVHEKEPVTIRTKYENYDGRFVLHCHILTHEDRGMMQLVEISKHQPPRCGSGDDASHVGHDPTEFGDKGDPIDETDAAAASTDDSTGGAS